MVMMKALFSSILGFFFICKGSVDLVKPQSAYSKEVLHNLCERVSQSGENALVLQKLLVPVITEMSWGKVIVRDYDVKNNADFVQVNTYKDCIITPSGAYDWDWSKTGLSHKGGISIEDVVPLLDKADVFILSRGVDFVLQVQAKTVEYLWKNGKEVFVLQSYEAAIKYNELVARSAGKKIALLLHSTC
jgi:hypothetical protein